MEFMVVIAMIAIFSALLLPALAKAHQRAHGHEQIPGWIQLGEAVCGLMILVDSILAIVALRKIEVRLKLQPSSIWSGRTLSQKLIREFTRWVGALGGSFLLALTAWLAFHPEATIWLSGRECTQFAMIWAASLLPVSAMLYYGILGARKLHDQATVWCFSTANGLLRR